MIDALLDQAKQGTVEVLCKVLGCVSTCSIINQVPSQKPVILRPKRTARRAVRVKLRVNRPGGLY